MLETYIERDEPAVAQSVVDQTDGYTRSVAGVEIEAIRTGTGVGSNDVLTVSDARYVATRSDIGFPMMLRTTVGDDRLIIGHVVEAPPGARWCEIDLTPGAVIAYGPGAEHTGVSLPGLRFMFVVTRRDEIFELADLLELDIEQPPRGEVHELAPCGQNLAVATALRHLADDAALGSNLRHQGDEVLRTMAEAFTVRDRVRRLGSRRRVDSRHVTHRCLDYVNAKQRIPSISELCLVAHVSERRLRQAFVDVYDVAPNRFFKAWALEEAHRRLLDAHPAESTVSRVATDLGLYHPGRFAGHYRHSFGEAPSATLRSTVRSR